MEANTEIIRNIITAWEDDLSGMPTAEESLLLAVCVLRGDAGLTDEDLAKLDALSDEFYEFCCWGHEDVAVATWVIEHFG